MKPTGYQEIYSNLDTAAKNATLGDHSIMTDTSRNNEGGRAREKRDVFRLAVVRASTLSYFLLVL